jgi:signal transduction histidine kinase
MLFIAMIFLVLALFVLARIFRGYPAIWLGLVFFTFGCCIVGLAGLIPRFGNYQLAGWLSLPLDQPSWVWRILPNLSLYDFMRFRLWTAIGFIIALFGFGYCYSFQKRRYSDLFSISPFIAIALFLLYSYDPQQLFELYIQGTTLINNPLIWTRWEQQLYLKDLFALGLIIITIAWVVHHILMVFANTTILQKKVQALYVGIGSLMLGTLFVLLFCVGRSTVFNAYTMATTLLPLGSKYPVFNSVIFLIIPLVSVIAAGMVLIAITRYGFLGTSRIGTKKLEQQISVANQAVRLALHSFKNRFLAAQMAMNMAMFQLKDLPEQDTQGAKSQIESALSVCTEALAGLDKLHEQAKRLEVNPRWVDLRELVEQALLNCCLGLQETVVSKRYSNAKLFAWGDREHLITVLENLFQNAMDAMDEKQNSGEPEPHKLTIETGLEYEWGYIRIIDNGAGIPRENLHKVFRPFFTTKPSKSNWGLGLTYCHRVIKIHRGFINLRSKAGNGTIVEVVLRCRENVNIISNI